MRSVIIALFLGMVCITSNAQAKNKHIQTREMYNVSNDISNINHIFNEHIRMTVQERCNVNLEGDLSGMIQRAYEHFHNNCQNQHIRDRECYYTKEQYCKDVMESYKDAQ